MGCDSTNGSLDNSGHAYDATTGVITLAGSNLLTVGVNAGDSVKGILDFTKLTGMSMGAMQLL